MAPRTHTEPAADVLEQRVAELESMLTIVTRFAAHLAVRISPGHVSATFREIAVNELRLCQHPDVDRIETWLTRHGS